MNYTRHRVNTIRKLVKEYTTAEIAVALLEDYDEVRLNNEVCLNNTHEDVRAIINHLEIIAKLVCPDIFVDLGVEDEEERLINQMMHL